MEDNKLKKGLKDFSKAQTEMRQIVDCFFRAGGFENQMALLAVALQDIVNKGAGEDTASLDYEFEYTNRYIRESVYEITELQKFLVGLRESYLRYRKCSEFLSKNNIPEDVPFFLQKKTN